MSFDIFATWLGLFTTKPENLLEDTAKNPDMDFYRFTSNLFMLEAVLNVTNGVSIALTLSTL